MKGKHGLHAQAEQLREKLLNDNTNVFVKDYGTRPDGQRMVSDIAKRSLSTSKFSSLYQRIITTNNFTNILELGTSLGINALYLSSNKGSKLTTFEGSDAIADIAELTFEFAGVKNITLVKGDINQTLSRQLPLLRKLDFVLIDANHTYEATSQYFGMILNRLHDKSVLVIDDIHYSKGMERAWNELREHDLVYGSVDLYRAGILFFDPSLNKQHVILQF